MAGPTGLPIEPSCAARRRPFASVLIVLSRRRRRRWYDDGPGGDIFSIVPVSGTNTKCLSGLLRGGEYEGLPTPVLPIWKRNLNYEPPHTFPWKERIFSLIIIVIQLTGITVYIQLNTLRIANKKNVS